jgi:hypothetical protein
LLLAFTSTVIRGSTSQGTQEHILLSHDSVNRAEFCRFLDELLTRCFYLAIYNLPNSSITFTVIMSHNLTIFMKFGTKMMQLHTASTLHSLSTATIPGQQFACELGLGTTLMFLM